MGRSITERQPDGTVIYKADRYQEVPDLDLLTLLLGEFQAAPTELRQKTETHIAF